MHLDNTSALVHTTEGQASPLVPISELCAVAPWPHNTQRVKQRIKQRGSVIEAWERITATQM
jgi:hypothetical protein